MGRKILVVLVSVVALFLTFESVRAEEPALQPYLYTQDFEGEDPVKFWTSGGESTINFQGLTEEKSFSGKKSAKFDVTFHGGANEYVYCYWKIPLGKVPAEGELKMTARVFVGEETTPKKAGDARLGVNCKCYHGNINGMPWEYCGLPTGEWKLLEMDLVKLAKQDVNRVMKKHLWGVTADNTGFCINWITFSLHGAKGKRVVLYVDDIKIEGKIPAEEDYKKTAEKRWTASGIEKKTNEKIISWEKETAMIQEKIESVSTLSPETELMKKEAKERLSSLKESIRQGKDRGHIKPAQAELIDSSIALLKSIISNIEVIAGQGGMVSLKDMLCYVIANPTTSSERILPNSTVRGTISDTISVIACKGEYEPASFVIHPLRDITLLEITPTDLKGKAGVISSKNVDIKVVKCWYCKGKYLLPELLLNDDTLVKVDYKEREHYLKLSYPEGQKYVWISNPEKPKMGEFNSFRRHGQHYTMFPVKDYPVKDSSSLLQVDIPAKTNKQFWLTLNVPEDAEPGVYKGKINLSTPKESLGSINLRLKVLPFELSKPHYTSSIYYKGKLYQDYPDGTISEEIKSEAQLRAELKNMFDHGVTNPICYQGFDEKLLGEYLRIMNEVGMGNQTLYFMFGAWANPSVIKKVIEFTKSYGIPEVYFYGRDEAKGEKLKAQRLAWEAVHKAGGKVFVSGYKGRNFKAMGDIQDLFNLCLYPSREEAAKWHSIGHKIWCYCNPQAGHKDPLIYRRNFGLLLWQVDYDGACTYAYQAGSNSIWNPFDGREHLAFTLPTVDGVIDTIAWEGYREGVDDVRYLTTLINSIRKAKKSRNKRIRKIRISAEKYLEELKESSLTERNLGTIRLEMINYILKLGGEK